MTVYYGEIDYYSEEDYYNVYLRAGKTYYIEAVGTGRNDLVDPYLILNTDRQNIIFDNNGGDILEARIVFTPFFSGYYPIRVGGNREWEMDAWDGTGTYVLSINIDDYRNTANGVGEAPAIGNTRGPASGEINYLGDLDVFSTTLVSGLTYTFTQRGHSTGNGSLADPELRLLGASGDFHYDPIENEFYDYYHEVARNNDAAGSYNSAIVYRADYTGAHYLQAGASSDGYTGSYEVNVGAGRATIGNDVVNGTAFADSINGLQGADNIRGGGGADHLFGAQHGDVLRGQAGNDRLAGGLGADILIGGAGADTFVYGGPLDSTPQAVDVIRAGDGAAAFQLAGRAGGDRIDLSAIDANILRPGNQGFIFNSTAAGGLSFADSRGDTLVRGNLDNDAAFELVIRIEDGGLSHRAYGAIDFLL